ILYHPLPRVSLPITRCRPEESESMNSRYSVPPGLLFSPMPFLEALEVNLATFSQFPSLEAPFQRSETFPWCQALDGSVDCDEELEVVSLGSTRRLRDTLRTVNESTKVLFSIPGSSFPNPIASLIMNIFRTGRYISLPSGDDFKPRQALLSRSATFPASWPAPSSPTSAAQWLPPRSPRAY
ncbi:hypothetical protein C8J56DRAFT_940271, partial [Mycena floridula]